MIMPAPFVSVGSPGGATLVAASASTNVGYGITPLFGSNFGSLTPDTTSNGNLISGIIWGGSINNHFIYIADAEPALSTITIDGTPYALSFAGTTGGYDIYSFSSGVQRIFDGNTYSVELS